MTRPATTLPPRSGSNSTTVVQAVTVIMGTVVGLTFLFGFGNVLDLALRLSVPVWVAPLVAPRCRPLDPRTSPRQSTPGPGGSDTGTTAASTPAADLRERRDTGPERG